jgi:hypothetical protein
MQSLLGQDRVAVRSRGGFGNRGARGAARGERVDTRPVLEAHELVGQTSGQSALLKLRFAPDSNYVAW